MSNDFINTKEGAYKRLFKESEDRVRKETGLQTAIFGAVFMMVGVSLDMVVYPTLVSVLFFNRLTTALLLILVGFTAKLIDNRKTIRLTQHIIAILPIISVSYMIYETEGATSPYYGGLNIILIGLSLLLRWSTIDSVINVILCLTFYAIAIAMSGASWADAFIPSYFVFVTGAVASTGTFYFNQGRFREFWLAKEQEEIQLEKEKSLSLNRLSEEIFHDINTPVTYITLALNNAKKYANEKTNETNPSLVKCINDALAGCQKVESMSESFWLLVGSAESKRLQFKNIFLKVCINDAIRIASIASSPVKLICDVDEKVLIKGDFTQISRVFTNLIVNAKEALSQKTDKPTIHISSNVDNLHHVVVIRDNGCGIPRENLDSIFEPYFSTKDKNLNRGIGLSTVFNILKSHNVDITVNSVVDSYTEFRLKFPKLRNIDG